MDGAFNFIPWKLRMQMVLVEVEIWGHVEKVIATLIDLTKLAAHNKKETKDNKIAKVLELP